jgi:hypothetical protein
MSKGLHACHLKKPRPEIETTGCNDNDQYAIYESLKNASNIAARISWRLHSHEASGNPHASVSKPRKRGLSSQEQVLSCIWPVMRYSACRSCCKRASASSLGLQNMSCFTSLPSIRMRMSWHCICSDLLTDDLTPTLLFFLSSATLERIAFGSCEWWTRGRRVSVTLSSRRYHRNVQTVYTCTILKSIFDVHDVCRVLYPGGNSIA